jgi:homeobox protein Nkx-3.2
MAFELSEKLSKRKRRKNRTAFTNYQIYVLEKRFTHQRYLTPHDRDQIAIELRLSAAQIITVSCFFLKCFF